MRPRAIGWAQAVLLTSLLAGCAVPPPPPPQPGIAAAEAHVNRAIYVLHYRTANDFRGHKAKALRLLRAARRQLQEAQADASP